MYFLMNPWLHPRAIVQIMIPAANKPVSIEKASFEGNFHVRVEFYSQAVHTTVSQSLEKAIGAGELSPRDQALVTDMWENLFQQASQQ